MGLQNQSAADVEAHVDQSGNALEAIVERGGTNFLPVSLTEALLLHAGRLGCCLLDSVTPPD